MKRFKSFFSALLILIIIMSGIDVFACEFNEQFEENVQIVSSDNFEPQLGENTAETDNLQMETAAENDAVETKILNSDVKTLKIESEEDFMEFAQSCILDTYSVGLQVILESDLDLSGMEFNGIPWFVGTFDGNNHSILGVNIIRAGINTGFFRTIGKEGIVKNLNIEGTVTAEETAQNVGGIAGDNLGSIINCNFEGDIEGLTCVGGITGFNEESGAITSCNFNGNSKGEHQIGGIAGTNNGTISLCVNSGLINTEAIIVNEEKSENLVSDFISGVTEISRDEILDVTDIGGIAGYSSGTVYSCENLSTVGYKHIGYNVGGICGRSSGFVSECSSSENIFGKNDVGGIVGQLEPYAAWDLSDSNLEKLKNSFSEFENSVTTLKNNISSTSSEISSSVSSVVSAATKTQTAFASVIEKAVSKSSEAADALEKTIENINEENAREELKSLAQKLKEMAPDTSELTNAVTETAAAAETLRSSITADRGLYENATSVIDSLSKFMDTGLNTAGNLGVSEDYLNDISVASAYTENRGAIDKCTSSSDVHGDTGLGGVVGTMDFEISFDLENQLNLSDYLFGNARYQVFAVTRDSVFNGNVEVKKANAGGICGKENFGLLINSNASGEINSEDADYVGGIAGLSNASIINCYSRMNMNGNSYIGGIAGKGNNISGCVAYSFIKTGREITGGICGETEGTVENNFYVSDSSGTGNERISTYGGIDGVDYEGKAKSITYDEMCRIEAVPDSFKKIEVTFIKDGEIIEVYEIPYGGSVKETPEVEPEDGKFWKWDDFQRENITNSFTVSGSFNEPIKTISTDEEIPMFLAEGSFNEGQKLVVEEQEDNVYSISITNFEGPAVIRMKGTNLDVSLKVSDEETKAVEKTEDGSYTVFTADLPCTIEVKENVKQSIWIVFVIIGAAILTVIIVLVIVFRKRKNKALCKTSDEKEDSMLIEINNKESRVEKTDKNDSEELKNGEESNEV